MWPSLLAGPTGHSKSLRSAPCSCPNSMPKFRILSSSVPETFHQRFPLWGCHIINQPMSVSFGKQFGDQMSDTPFNNAAYKRFCAKTERTCPSLPTTLQVDGKQLWKQMMVEASTPNLPIIKLIKRLRESGKYRVAALTNNFQLPAGKTEDDQEALGLAPMEIKNLFHEFIESSQVGLRKPDPKFFEYALKLLNVRSPKEVVFFDDIGINLKAAEKLGINTIKVGINDVKPALEQLQKYLPDLDLKDIINSAKL
ncbi:hypothetical protein PGT21_020460 [Puccinia graminis f. sp. tritici]|uniref:Uncharacterized protein n=1 Tax=Puccinia graminis f. sp. tritici TaxID=56615 RepID=A0A5B0NAU5_PUCGR|nr:hypothetical protein PGT21_020460 [Puccinia graminis f. sp. tritici]